MPIEIAERDKLCAAVVQYERQLNNDACTAGDVLTDTLLAAHHRPCRFATLLLSSTTSTSRGGSFLNHFASTNAHELREGHRLMTSTILKGHPTNLLYVVVSSNLTNALMDAVEARLKDWPSERRWTIQAPELIDYIDEDPASGSESHTFGFALRLYSAHPPWGKGLPKEVDRQHLDEVEYILNEAELISTKFECSFKLQLDQIAMGNVANGKRDERLHKGLINEWRKAHGLALT